MTWGNLLTTVCRRGLMAALMAGIVVTSGSCFDSNSVDCANGLVCPQGTQCSADVDNQVCIADTTTVCGNGTVDSGEECDDGNLIDDDGCRNDCLSDETCGNGVLDAHKGEVCDDGNVVDTDMCSADCKSENACGNGINDFNEECDDGLHCTDGTACTAAADCAGIGDGTCARRDDDGCDTNCTATACGNNVTTTGEVCDDGKHCTNGAACTAESDCTGVGDGTCAPRDGDGCDADCSVTGCGNGVASGTEVCDDGKHCQNGVSCSNDSACTGIGDEVCITRDRDGCSADCTSDETCGNIIVDTLADEVCDDGTQCSDGTDCNDDTECAGIGDALCKPRDGDGCSATCRSNETCGNTITDTAVSEVCDNGKHCQDGTTCLAASECVSVGDELCQSRAGDGCNLDCTSDETCGNGITDPAVGETCDDGKHCEDGSACTSAADCVGVGDTFCLPRDGGGNNCRADCKGGTDCGNGLIDPGEECDDGNAVDTDDCTSCVRNLCGDSVRNITGPLNFEACDDGVQTATCDVDCTVAECGDGLVNPLNGGEQCDNLKTCSDGAACTGDLDCVGIGDTVCVPRDSNGCDFDCTISICGDGYTNLAAGEGCDTSGASATCDSDCTSPICGDGLVNVAASEQCDGGTTGTPVQTATCDLDCSISICGDGTTNATAGEACDDSGNSATCNADCSTSTCGDAFINPVDGELCDEPTCSDTTSCTVDADCVGIGDQICIARDTANCDDDCTLALCGDNNTNTAASEDCDDGAETSTCNANCTTSTCGDGVVNATDGEQCDAGTTGTPVQTAACDLNCTVAFCGDGTTNATAGEDCDDSAQTSTCDSDCTSVVCGDGISNTAAGEACDDGMHCTDGTGGTNGSSCTLAAHCNGIGDGTCAPRDNDGCAADCSSTEGCGNNVEDPGEVCDDGNNINGDDCSADCLSDETCGNGITDVAVGEVCDDGKHCQDLSGGTAGATCNENSDCSGIGDQKCKVRDNGNGCDNKCKRTGTCGDNIHQDLFEECDDGDSIDGNDCTNACTTPVCGDGVTYSLGGGTEDCDEGLRCTDGTTLCTDTTDCIGIGDASCAVRAVNGCSLTCTSDGSCGNFILDAGEGCDDGMNGTGDGCDDACKVETNSACNADTNGDVGAASCASGLCDTVGQAAPGICEPVLMCGNGLIEAGESCDDGNTANGDGCHGTTCLRDDGVACTADAQCTNVCDTVGSNTCETAGCGDGAITAGESCDDGNTNNGDGCDGTSCLKEDGVACTADAECDNVCDTVGSNTCETAGCGDGAVNLPEVCDDANSLACGTCNATCATELTAAAAAGSLTTVADASDSLDGTVVTLDDGINASAITFELDSDAGCIGTATNICVTFATDDTAQTIADLMVAAIDGVGGTLLIDAANGGGTSTTVSLTHDRNSSLGNQTVDIGTTGFTKSDMTGGLAGDCTAGIECKSGDDCVSGACTGGTCD